MSDDTTNILSAEQVAQEVAMHICVSSRPEGCRFCVALRSHEALRTRLEEAERQRKSDATARERAIHTAQELRERALVLRGERDEARDRAARAEADLAALREQTDRPDWRALLVKVCDAYEWTLNRPENAIGNALHLPLIDARAALGSSPTPEPPAMRVEYRAAGDNGNADLFQTEAQARSVAATWTQWGSLSWVAQSRSVTEWADLPPIEAAPSPSPEEAGERGWIVDLICCSTDDGIYEAATWAEAEAFRQAYVNGGGHTRVGIIRRVPLAAPVDSPSEPERECEACEGTGWSYFGPPHLPIAQRKNSGRKCPSCGGSGKAHPTTCPTCGSGDPMRSHGLPYFHLSAQLRCRDKFHPTTDGEGT